jgi:hypothetical protein
MPMNRTEFEALRDLPGKAILADIAFVRGRVTSPLLVVENVSIQNTHDVDVRLNITYNPEVGSVSFNVHVSGVGPICRLDIDGPPHRPAGRCHKHALKTERCPDRNLPDDVQDRPDLSGRPVRVLFVAFCEMANITHQGTFTPPDETGLR